MQQYQKMETFNGINFRIFSDGRFFFVKIKNADLRYVICKVWKRALLEKYLIEMQISETLLF